MSSRRTAAKPSIALWMLVAIGDVALIVASMGLVALIALVSVVTVAVAAVGSWRLLRRGVPGRNVVSPPVAVSGRTRSVRAANQVR